MASNGDPDHHMQNVGQMLNGIIEHLRADIEMMDEPKAQAMFETMAEVLQGLKTACAHYQQNIEIGMRR